MLESTKRYIAHIATDGIEFRSWGEAAGRRQVSQMVQLTPDGGIVAVEGRSHYGTYGPSFTHERTCPLDIDRAYRACQSEIARLSKPKYDWNANNGTYIPGPVAAPASPGDIPTDSEKTAYIAAALRAFQNAASRIT